jgi:hypothetical protein
MSWRQVSRFQWFYSCEDCQSESIRCETFPEIVIWLSSSSRKSFSMSPQTIIQGKKFRICNNCQAIWEYHSWTDYEGDIDSEWRRFFGYGSYRQDWLEAANRPRACAFRGLSDSKEIKGDPLKFVFVSQQQQRQKQPRHPATPRQDGLLSRVLKKFSPATKTEDDPSANVPRSDEILCPPPRQFERTSDGNNIPSSYTDS